MINNIRKFGTYYTLFHIPSKMYYVPFNFKSYTNLNSFGKLFTKFPDFFKENINSFYYNKKGEKKPIILKEWEIHEVVVGLINKTNCKDDADRKHTNKTSKFITK